MEYIKSSFTKNTLWWTIPWALFISLLSLLFIIKMIKASFNTETDFIGLFFGILLFIGLPTLMFYMLKIRYYIIENKQLKYYSIFYPFGKTLYFDNYIGKIETTESGSDGSYKVIYLVDRNHCTAFKIMGLHYKKFGELSNAIPLRKLDFSPTRGQYFKLLFFRRMKIAENEADKVN